MVTAKFVVNNKIHLITKVFLFIVNYSRDLRMRANIRKKEKNRKDDRVYC